MEPSLTKDDQSAVVYIKDTKGLFFGYEKQVIQKKSVVECRELLLINIHFPAENEIFVMVDYDILTDF